MVSRGKLIVITAFVFVESRAFSQDADRESSAELRSEETRTAGLDIQVSVAGSAFGPITYDKLGLFKGTGVAKRDPNFFSYEPSIKFERLLGSGGLYLRLFWRYFQPTINDEIGNFQDDDEVAASGKVTVTSSGPGLEAGWNFSRRRDPKASYFPYLGLAVEKNTVQVKGERQDYGLATQKLGYSSKLDAVYSRLGLGWRPFPHKVQIEIISGLYVPIWSVVRDGRSNAAEHDVGERLHHGIRTGGFLGIGAGIFNGDYEKNTLRTTRKKTAARRRPSASAAQGGFHPRR